MKQAILQSIEEHPVTTRPLRTKVRFNLAARLGDGSSAFYLSQMYLNGEAIKQDRVVASVWATVAFAKRIEGVGEILTVLDKELTEKEIDQSIRILIEINKKHLEMLGGLVAHVNC